MCIPRPGPPAINVGHDLVPVLGPRLADLYHPAKQALDRGDFPFAHEADSQLPAISDAAGRASAWNPLEKRNVPARNRPPSLIALPIKVADLRTPGGPLQTSIGTMFEVVGGQVEQWQQFQGLCK